ncbi:peptidoglycan DD-metalloendopeptidase family protein [Arthrobacter sp. B1805]|uniref:peptidoglycan DD-metalloendopeptidase family protein n=1 Tax=Arthrobacter sp. B1805 TaxID=2058892 RepID=UPI002157B470|nr:peptidoglycan DD-metalloendopeptidase family protein [Arthrobacter sp. B1805]
MVNVAPKQAISAPVTAITSRRRRSGGRTSASIALVVCFIGVPGVVPSPAHDAISLGIGSSQDITGTPADPATGSVGTPLLPTDTTTSGTHESLEAQAKVRAASLKETGADAAASARRPAEGMLLAPLEVLVPTSAFGYRISPITGEAGEFHTGQDYAAPCGTPVQSADAGTVRAVGWHPWGGGNRVEVDHGNGLITTYNHLQGISVSTGDTVNGGQTIATIGTTGSSTGCHLHFETILHGEHVDPQRWKLQLTAPDSSAQHFKDYTPGAGSPTDIPSWAQSVTRAGHTTPAAPSGLGIPELPQTPLSSGTPVTPEKLPTGTTPDPQTPPTSPRPGPPVTVPPPVPNPDRPQAAPPAAVPDAKPKPKPEPTQEAAPTPIPTPSPELTPTPTPGSETTPTPDLELTPEPEPKCEVVEDVRAPVPAPGTGQEIQGDPTLPPCEDAEEDVEQDGAPVAAGAAGPTDPSATDDVLDGAR